MAEAIIEQIAAWITAAIDGEADPGATLTMNAVRPTNSDWDVSHFKHGDVIIELAGPETNSKTTTSRTEIADWKLYGIVTTLPANTALDTVMSRLSETIRRTLLAGNSGGLACGGLALLIDCPSAVYSVGDGCDVVEVACRVKYQTELKDGYAQ